MLRTGDWVTRRAELTPEAVALWDGDTSAARTYADWARDVAGTAGYLATELGVRKGDRVAIIGHNSWSYLDLWAACGRLGAVLQTLNWRLSPASLARLIREAEPRVVFCSRAFEPISAAMQHSAPGVEHWLPLESTLSEGREAFVDRAPTAVVAPDDPWVLCYTGGTTGQAKGAMLTHGSVLHNAINTVAGWSLTAGDCAALNAPLFHTGGLNVFTSPLVLCGGASVVCRGFDVDQVFDLVERRRINLLFGVPTMFMRMQQHPRFDAVPWSDMRIVISGGAPCPSPVTERFHRRRVPFKSGYGLTEAGPNNFWLPDDEVGRRSRSVGKPLPFVDVMIVRADGTLAGPGERGELLLAGPHLFSGYFRRPEETAAAVKPHPADPTGRTWLHTGDVACRDDRGFVAIVDRLKHVIISGGENIYASEVEEAVLSHPEVVEAAAVAWPDEEWGEVVRLYVVTRSPLTERELIDYCRARLAGFQVPRSVVWRDELPKTAAGKIDRRALEGDGSDG